MFIVIGKQAIMMALLLLVGGFCVKKGYLSKEASDALSSIVLHVVNPAVIFSAYLREREVRLMQNLLLSLGLSAAVMLIGILLARLLFRGKNVGDRSIERVSAVYSNCGFMGIPLVDALLGSEGVFYLTGFMTVFNALIWTHGIISISGETDLKNCVKILKSSSILAIFAGLLFFFCGIGVPEVIRGALTHIGNMNTPLAMIVAGATIARTDLRSAVKNLRVYAVAAVKLILMPLLSFALVAPLPIAQEVKLTIVLAMAAPCAVTCTLFAITHKKNEKYAVSIFALSTILSILTLPLVGVLF